MSEQTMRKNVIKALKPLHAVAVENPCLPGTPDVNYIEGWVELKWLRSWPARPDTVVHFEHYTTQQKIFALLRRRKGGQCWFLLQCKREWLLLDGAVAAMVVNRCTRQELISHATAYWDTGLSDEDLVFLLSQKLPAKTFTADEVAKIKGTP